MVAPWRNARARGFLPFPWLTIASCVITTCPWHCGKANSNPDTRHDRPPLQAAAQRQLPVPSQRVATAARPNGSDGWLQVSCNGPPAAAAAAVGAAAVGHRPAARHPAPGRPDRPLGGAAGQPGVARRSRHALATGSADCRPRSGVESRQQGCRRRCAGPRQRAVPRGAAQRAAGGLPAAAARRSACAAVARTRDFGCFGLPDQPVHGSPAGATPVRPPAAAAAPARPAAARRVAAAAAGGRLASLVDGIGAQLNRQRRARHSGGGQRRDRAGKLEAPAGRNAWLLSWLQAWVAGWLA